MNSPVAHAPLHLPPGVACISRGRIGSKVMGQQDMGYSPKYHIIEERCRRAKRRPCFCVFAARETGAGGERCLHCSISLGGQRRPRELFSVMHVSSHQMVSRVL